MLGSLSSKLLQEPPQALGNSLSNRANHITQTLQTAAASPESHAPIHHRGALGSQLRSKLEFRQTSVANFEQIGKAAEPPGHARINLLL